MRTIKNILAVLAIILAVAAIIGAAAGIYYSWALNTQVTESLDQVTASVERVLTRADDGLTRVRGGLDSAHTATSTIEGAVMAAGETIVATDLAFTVLERTVGDTLFPVLVRANETATAIIGTVVSANDALEAANRLPFVQVPTITAELQAASDEVAAAREQMEALRDDIATMKAEAVARPVAAVTDRTQPLLGHLDAARTHTAAAQTAVTRGLEQMETTRATLPGRLDRLSLILTLVLLWTIAGQIALIVLAVAHLRRRA